MSECGRWRGRLIDEKESASGDVGVGVRGDHLMLELDYTVLKEPLINSEHWAA